jgi:hypothetical protein
MFSLSKHGLFDIKGLLDAKITFQLFRQLMELATAVRKRGSRGSRWHWETHFLKSAIDRTRCEEPLAADANCERLRNFNKSKGTRAVAQAMLFAMKIFAALSGGTGMTTAAMAPVTHGAVLAYVAEGGWRWHVSTIMSWRRWAAGVHWLMIDWWVIHHWLIDVCMCVCVCVCESSSVRVDSLLLAAGLEKTIRTPSFPEAEQQPVSRVTPSHLKAQSRIKKEKDPDSWF